MEGEEATKIESSAEEGSQVELEQGNHRRACLATWKTEMEELSQEVQESFRDNFWDNNRENYEPKVVSIGPLHRGKQGLIFTNKIKLEILRDILIDQPDNTLEIFFDEVFQCIGEVREEYSEKIDLTDEEFTKLLVIDGCFLIVFCSLHKDDGGFLLRDMARILAKVLKNITSLISDLFLLENQIPFFVVNMLFQKLRAIIPILEEAFPNFMSLFFAHVRIYLPPEKCPEEEDVCHLLHLVCISKDPSLLSDEPYPQPRWHEVMIQMKQPIRYLFFLISRPFLGLFYLILFCDCSGLFRAPKRSNYEEIIPTATKLRELGMNFQMKATPYNVGQCHISLRGRTFEIPQLYVHYSTVVVFKNLIAFEQSTAYAFSSYVTSYCSLWNQIINTDEDVGILRESRILQNNLGSDSELAEMFNSLSNQGILEILEKPYEKLREEVHKLCDVPHHKWRASLLNNYFQSPWTFFSVAAATIIVVFTVTQTVFTIFPRK